MDGGGIRRGVGPRDPCDQPFWSWRKRHRHGIANDRSPVLPVVLAGLQRRFVGRAVRTIVQSPETEIARIRSGIRLRASGAWLCFFGAAPPLGVFVFFGIAAVWTYTLAIFSIRRLRGAIADAVWRLLSFVGLNYILLAFVRDFIGAHFEFNTNYLVGYLPFILLCILAPSLRFIAVTRGLYLTWRNPALPEA